MGTVEGRSRVRMLARRRRHKDPCFANGRSVISTLLTRDEAPSSPNPEGAPLMRSMTARRAVLAAILVSLAVPTMASATVSTAEINESLAKGVTYLKGLQSEATGEITGFGGDWCLASLPDAVPAAADENKSGVAGRDARSW